jgi:hypothetical protein
MVIREGSETDLSIKMKSKLKTKGPKWDGKSRVSNDLYRKNYDEIFKKNSNPFDIKVKEEKISDEEFKKIIDRNGF